jgi:hypothetical protein
MATTSPLLPGTLSSEPVGAFIQSDSRRRYGAAAPPHWPCVSALLGWWGLLGRSPYPLTNMICSMPDDGMFCTHVGCALRLGVRVLNVATGSPTTPLKSRQRLPYARGPAYACAAEKFPLAPTDDSTWCFVHHLGQGAHQLLTGKITFAPIRSRPGVARPLPNNIPADFECLKQWLSSQRWEEGDVDVDGSACPKLVDGCVRVCKVYYYVGQEERRSFFDPATFKQFLGYLAKHASARLLLWDDTTSAPSSPERQGIVCAVVAAFDWVAGTTFAGPYLWATYPRPAGAAPADMLR